mmetsp:Transcript_33695/g.104015  ORF Transcript_33695/g.104015 Transcript_33695/m.104015 type:complete len:211 (-) Transcript_33695:31-663(-)
MLHDGFFLKLTFGGRWFNRSPTVSNSSSILRRCASALPESSIIRIMSAVRAVAMTCLPRPLPSAAPSMMPGRSRIWISVPLYITLPGMHVSVVNSYAATAESVLVVLLRKDDLPTEGKPTRATRTSPERLTSKPAMDPWPDARAAFSSISVLMRASCPLRRPTWYSVRLFFCVLAISSSIAFFRSSKPMAVANTGTTKVRCFAANAEDAG